MKRLIKIIKSPILTIPEPLTANYFPFLDGLRGLAILMVLLPHFGINKYLYHTSGMLIESDTGVHLFFIISGFLITTLLLKEKVTNGKISLKYFYIRRALRILPVAYLFLVVLAILNIIFRLHLSAFDFIGAGTFITNLPMGGSYYTAHFWSLAVEEQFYLVFPLLLVFNLECYFIVGLLLITVVPLTCIAATCFPTIAGGGLFVKSCMYAFWKGPVIILIGSVCAIMVFKQMITLKASRLYAFGDIILLVIAIIIRTRNFQLYTKYASEYISAILMAFVIIFSFGQKGPLIRILTSKILMRIGILSYSLYIWQQLFIGSNTWQPWMRYLHGLPLWQLVIFKIGVVFVIAFFSYQYEWYFLKIKEKLKYNKGKIR
ncbi:acyltransferase [Mucilaginibacter corticis]|uniref:Acyltransferase n=1 Tax=Mucilaginibacter corticis TaxID=2597670 RepID=A0A556M827_9SPHI|nr:acyltransferase [Mucilaginibacter corticis]TSJ35946.1 acyltransferase [Mucilaginibacter corticis]